MIAYRRLEAYELARIADIDRTERIDSLYVQRGTTLEPVAGDFSASPWRAGEGAHSVAEQVEECERYLSAGGTAIGALAGERLVGIGVVVPHLRPGVAQLAYLHVSNGFRGQGIGVHLAEALQQIAVDAGNTTMVVSATPSANTVAFYRGRGFEPAEPLPELFELEPEDVHLKRRIGP
jgi:ribosomal protein S18 acetylase RimI-like enzyme